LKGYEWHKISSLKIKKVMGQPEGTAKPNDKQEQNTERDFEVAANPNPRANENIRIRTEIPASDQKKSDSVGSEITDGEGG
jgi:hypothetical protein